MNSAFKGLRRAELWRIGPREQVVVSVQGVTQQPLSNVSVALTEKCEKLVSMVWLFGIVKM